MPRIVNAPFMDGLAPDPGYTNNRDYWESLLEDAGPAVPVRPRREVNRRYPSGG